VRALINAGSDDHGTGESFRRFMSLGLDERETIALGVTANKRNKLKWFVHSLRFFEVLAVLITCYFLLQHNRIMHQQIQENILSNKLQVA
jgi:hypothetical protein